MANQTVVQLEDKLAEIVGTVYDVGCDFSYTCPEFTMGLLPVLILIN